MKKSVKVTFFLTLVAATTIWMVAAVVPQDKPADNMQMLRDKIKADKKLLVADNMELTESEAKAFGRSMKPTRKNSSFFAHAP